MLPFLHVSFNLLFSAFLLVGCFFGEGDVVPSTSCILMPSSPHFLMPFSFPFLSCHTLQDLGVSERLAVLIEGESLLNDGTSIVVFSVFFDAATGKGTTSVSTVVTQFARLGLGGPLVGLITGIIG